MRLGARSLCVRASYDVCRNVILASGPISDFNMMANGDLLLHGLREGVAKETVRAKQAIPPQPHSF